MSSAGTPPLSPFVRGTTNTSQVYYLAGATRRLVPDSQTLSFLLAGQTVRVLTDAALAAIPLETPLPSRKDGLLVTQKYATPPPAVIEYFMANGQRRRVPDIETQLIFVHSGVQAIQVEAADLNAIPEGPALPTRKDGTLYKGTGSAFAYLMQSGQKRALPDATTLSDSGYAFNNLTPITASDLSFIPEGAAFPSTSRFLSPPAAQVPLVLLPVRLETRFYNQNNAVTELWLRVYPDDVHVNSFEPVLTAPEQTARINYLALAKADTETRTAAFATLAQQFGPERAAWIASANVPSAPAKAADWTIAPFTNVLPERWIVIGYQGNAKGQVLAVGPPIQDSLPVGPAPNGPGAGTDTGMKWLTDFDGGANDLDSAVKKGMAFRIPLAPAQQRGFDRLLVLGLRTNLNSKDSAARLSDLLQAHHYTDGLELLAINTPTNNTEDVSAGLATRDPDYRQLFAVEQGPALCPTRSTADGDRLARALNMPPATFAHVRGANGAQDEQAQALNTVLWPATWGYYLSQMITGVVPAPETILPAASDHFAGHVRARGHFPTLRVGRQPYGILPVCWSAHWKSLEGRALDAPLHSLLAQLRSTIGKSVVNVPRIPQAANGDTEAALVSLLGMTPSSTSFIARNLVGPEYKFAFWNVLQKDLSSDWWNELAQKTRVDGSALAAALANTRLATATYLSEYRPLSDVLVAPDPLDGLPAPGFIAQLAKMGWQALRDAVSPTPIPLLFVLLRHAALREYMDAALELLMVVNAAQASERIEAEMVGFSGVALRPTAWELLQRVLPNKGAVGTVLDGSKSDATLPAFKAFWQAFGQLSTFSAADLDAATREVLDLASYRLDSWITSLAHFRLDQTRAANPSGGIVLGGYGWLENVRPDQQQVLPGGYVHAPSLNQATTAAVLRSGYLAHVGATDDGTTTPFQIDLSSARVRLALHLLDGVKEGQSLGALLGYRLERTLQDKALQDTGLYTLIDNLRSLAPLPGGAANQLDVVDGLALFRMWNPNASWVLALSAPLRTALTSAIGMLGDAIDSVADLALTESVHQLIRGNTLRAGATLDSIARGDTPPPEIDFVQTPRSGTALTYRLMTAAIGNNAPDWTITLRAQAEPRLNAWAAALLGNPALVRIRARFVDAKGASLSNVEIGLNQLALAPIDLLSFPDTAGISGELADRILRVVAQARPASVPANSTIEILLDRDPAWKPQTIGLTEWLGLLQAITRLTGASRPIEPADLIAQNDTPGTIDTAELQSRADAAETQLRAALAALQKATGRDTALMGAAAFGITGAVPALDSTLWAGQAAAVSTELTARGQAVDGLAKGFVRASATADASRDHDIARLKLIFGTSFQVLPVLSAALAANWPKLWANSLALQGGDALASVRWMQRASRVRSGVTRLDTTLLFAEALAGRPLLQLQVAQLPSVANDKWVGLEAAGTSPSSRLSLVAFSPTPFAAGAAIAGLMVDEWIDVWPSDKEITGVSFQYSDPIARAPQAILLAVHPDDFPEWTLEAVEGSVLEALDLAKIRGVDPDVLLGTVPPLPVDAGIKAFQALSDTDVFVLDTAGNLWFDQGPFGTVPPTRHQVNANVFAFQALSASEVFVQGTDGNLWLEHGPFGVIPPTRQQVDGNVALMRPTPVVPVTTQPPTTTSVPDLTVPLTEANKMPLKEAEEKLQAARLVGEFMGLATAKNPVVSSQSPAGGTEVAIGSTVIVNLVSGPAETL